MKGNALIAAIISIVICLSITSCIGKEGKTGKMKTISLAEADYAFPILVRGHYEYIDSQGRLIEGLDTLTPVNFNSEVLQAGLTFFDKNNKKLFEENYDDVKGFSEGLAPVMRKYLWGFINNKGDTVIPEQFEDAMPFSEGLAAVKVNGKYGYINKAGEIIIKPAYEIAMQFKDGMAVVARLRNDEYQASYGFINTEGKLVVPMEYEIVSDFSEGYALISDRDKNPFKNLFIDKEGNHVFKEYWPMFTFHEGLAGVATDQGIGYINTQGELVIGPQNFHEALPFSDGLAAVCFPRSDKPWAGGPWGFIDETGTLAIPLRFSIPYRDGMNKFSHGLAKIGEYIPQNVPHNEAEKYIEG